jgi:hypothetical protein
MMYSKPWKNHQPWLLYPVKLSFITEGEIKTVHEKQNEKWYMTTNPKLRKILKRILYTERKINATWKYGEESISLDEYINKWELGKTKPNTIINKMTEITAYFSITLKDNDLNSPTKRHRFAGHQ